MPGLPSRPGLTPDARAGGGGGGGGGPRRGGGAGVAGGSCSAALACTMWLRGVSPSTVTDSRRALGPPTSAIRSFQYC
ncbi:hypothetical protein, partial [Nocardia farcinica]|uniref:hypothetical protein n=1 Tax=Nocardia farcinica TaxID=37329 RepID=UPI0024587D26